MNRIVMAGMGLGLSIFLVGCSGQATEPQVGPESADGTTQVFNVETPNGTYQCISWKLGYGGGLDCDRLR